MVRFRKTQPGNMGILTIPAGTRIYSRASRGANFQRAMKDFDVLALPSWVGTASGGERAYSFKMSDQFWYVLVSDLPNEDD